MHLLWPLLAMPDKSVNPCHTPTLTNALPSLMRDTPSLIIAPIAKVDILGMLQISRKMSFISAALSGILVFANSSEVPSFRQGVKFTQASWAQRVCGLIKRKVILEIYSIYSLMPSPPFISETVPLTRYAGPLPEIKYRLSRLQDRTPCLL